MSLSYKFLLIVQSNHSQAVRRSCRTGRTAVTRSKDCFHILRFPFPASDFDQSPRNDADHIVQKTVSLYANGNNIMLPGNGTGINGAYTGLRLCICRTETYDFMFPYQLLCSILHFFNIQSMMIKIRIQSAGRHPESPVQNPVFVCLTAF